MSEHSAEELPEPYETEEEKAQELDEVTEVSHDAISHEETATLEAESTQYAQESEVLDRRMESQERVQALETASGSSTPEPAQPALRRGKAVRASAKQRQTTPVVSYDARYIARLQVASEKLAKLNDPLGPSRAEAEKTVRIYGTSLNEMLAMQLADADLKTPDYTKQILDSLAKHGWTADGLTKDLLALAAIGVPGQQADIATAAGIGERILNSLTAMQTAIQEVIDESHMPETTAGPYLGIVTSTSVGVAETLGTLSRGKGIRPWTKAQRCHDLASRFKSQEGGISGLDKPQAAANAANEKAKKAATKAAKEGATNEEKAAANEAAKAAEKAAAKLREALDAYRQSGSLNLAGKKEASANWDDALARARKALKGLNIDELDLAKLDKALKGMGLGLDARFDELRLAIEDLANPASIDDVIALGWEFTRLITSINFQLGKLFGDVGAGAAVLLNLQFTLASLAGYLGPLVSVRGGLTTT
jgi:hypothetical protein